MTRHPGVRRARAALITTLALVLGALVPAGIVGVIAPAVAADMPTTCSALPSDADSRPTTCLPSDSPAPGSGGLSVGAGTFTDYRIPRPPSDDLTGRYVEFPVSLPTLPACVPGDCATRVAARLYAWSSRDNGFFERTDVQGMGTQGIGPSDCVQGAGCAGPVWARFDTTYFQSDLDYYLSAGIAPRYLLVEDVIGVTKDFRTAYYHRFTLVRVPWTESSTPTAAFTAQDDTTRPGRITVTSTSSDPSGRPTFDTWDWGDGSGPSTGRFTTHDYASPGTYTITLTARADSGKTATTTRQVTIAAPRLSTSVQILEAAPPLAERTRVTVRVTASASSDGVGDLSALTFADASPLRTSPSTAFTLTAGPTPPAPSEAFTLAPGATRSWDYTLTTSSAPVPHYVLATNLTGKDAAGASVSSDATAPGEIGRSLIVDLSVDPSVLTLDEDASGPKPRDVTVTEKITNTTSRTMTDVVLRSLEPRRTSPGQPLAVTYRSGVAADPVNGTKLADLPPFGSATLTAVYTVADDGKVDFTSLVSAVTGDGTPTTGTGTVRLTVDPKYLLQVSSHVVKPEAGALLPAGSPIVIQGTVKNLTETSTAEVAPLFAQLTGNAGLQSFAWDTTGVDPRALIPGGSTVLKGGESKDFTLKVLTSYSEAVVGSSPLTHSPGSGGTSATVTLTPWATITEDDGTTSVTDPTTDLLTSASDLRHRVSIDDSIAIPETDGVAVAGGMLTGGIEGVWNAASGLVTGVIQLPGAAGSSVYALGAYQEQVWSGFSEEEKRAFADDTGLMAASVLMANYDRAKIGLPALQKQASDATYQYFTEAENNWRVGDYASTVQLYTGLASNGLAQVVLPAAIGKLAKSAAAARSVGAAQEARNARGAAAVNALTDAATIEETLPSLTAIESGTQLDPAQVRKLYGIGPDELARLQQLATERDISVVVRSRAASSLDWIEKGALVKPEAIKIKSVSGLDVLLGYPAKYEGALVLKEPEPLIAFLKNGGDPPTLVREFVESKGFVRGTSNYDAAVLRVNERITEWVDYSATYKQWSKRGWFETSFNYTGNAMNNPASAVEHGRFQGFHLDPTGSEGEYVVKMLNGELGRYVEVTGDIDPIAFTRTDGTPLSVEEHTSLLNAMSRDPLLRSQHGESTTFVKGGIAFIQKQFKPNEAALMIGPGGNPARAVRLNTGMSTWKSATDYRLIWDGGFVDTGVQPVSAATLESDSAAVMGRQPTPAPRTRIQTLPGGGTASAPNVGRCAVGFQAGAPALAMAADGQIGQIVGAALQPSALASVCFTEGPVVQVRMSPSTELSLDAVPGQTELPVRADAAVAAVGENGLRVGQEVVLDPGTPQAETGTISAFGSIILTAPLVSAHPAGTVIAVVREPAGSPASPLPPEAAGSGNGTIPSLTQAAAPARSIVQPSRSALATTGATAGPDLALIGALMVLLGLGLALGSRRRTRSRQVR